jgi:hypothetical protein
LKAFARVKTAAEDFPAAALEASVTRDYCVKALYLASDAFNSAIAASGSTPFALTPSAQVLTSGSAAFFHYASWSGVSV